MPTVKVAKPFTFTHSYVRDPNADDNSPHPKLSTTDDPTMHGKDEFFPVGDHEMSPAMADHWYVQAHSVNPPPVMPKPGTPEYAGHHIAAARRRAMVEAAIEQEAQDAAAAVRQDANLSGRIAENEEIAHAEMMEQREGEERAAAENEAARTGRRAAIPQRRQALPPRGAAATDQPAAEAQPDPAAPNTPPPPPAAV